MNVGHNFPPADPENELSQEKIEDIFLTAGKLAIMRGKLEGETDISAQADTMHTFVIDSRSEGIASLLQRISMESMKLWVRHEAPTKEEGSNLDARVDFAFTPDNTGAQKKVSFGRDAETGEYYATTSTPEEIAQVQEIISELERWFSQEVA